VRKKGKTQTSNILELSPWRKKKYAKKMKREEEEWKKKSGPVKVYYRG